MTTLPSNTRLHRQTILEMRSANLPAIAKAVFEHFKNFAEAKVTDRLTWILMVLALRCVDCEIVVLAVSAGFVRGKHGCSIF